MKQHNGVDENLVEVKQNPAIKMGKGNNSLLSKKQLAERQIKGVRI